MRTQCLLILAAIGCWNGLFDFSLNAVVLECCWNGLFGFYSNLKPAGLLFVQLTGLRFIYVAVELLF